jgi:hypothetical protein
VCRLTIAKRARYSPAATVADRPILVARPVQMVARKQPFDACSKLTRMSHKSRGGRGTRPIGRLAVLFIALFLGPLHGHANGKGHFFIFKLEFAAAAADDEALAHGIYLFQVWGGDSFIELQRITLNECSDAQSKEASFLPTVENWSTTSPLGLKATRVSDNQIELSLYQAFHHGFPATMTLIFDPNSPPFRKLIELKTRGFIDLKYFPGQIRYIDYVPVKTDRLKALNCPVYLRGLSSNPMQ